jgi:hypothetical protein
MGHGPHSSQLVNCVVLYIVCVEMCTVLLPPGVNSIAVNKCIIYHIIHPRVQSERLTFGLFIAVKLTLILKDYCKYLPSMKLSLFAVEQLV